MDMNERDKLVFFGAGITNQEMDVEFKKLYDSLITYKNGIFHFVDTLCHDGDAAERLAMNIAERDSSVLQRLVAKECEKRNMSRKARKESVLEKLRKESISESSVSKIVETRARTLNKSGKD